MSLTLRTSCLATAYTLSTTFSTKMAIAQEATVEVTEAPENTLATSGPTVQYTGPPVPENPILTATIVNPQSVSVGQLREDLASALGTDADDIMIDSYDPITGAMRFVISGNEAQAAGETFLSLDNAALAKLGIQEGSATLVNGDTNRGTTQNDSHTNSLWIGIGMTLAVLALIGAGIAAYMLLAAGKPKTAPPAAARGTELPPAEANSDLQIDDFDNSDLDMLPFQQLEANSDLIL